MTIKPGFELREVCGEQILVAEGIENIDFSKMISMNESAAYLWNSVKGIDFSYRTLADLLLQKYEVDAKTALADATEIADEWVKNGIVAL